VCTGKTACLDTAPRGGSSPVTYRVTALDHDTSGAIRESTPIYQSTIQVDQSANTAPDLGPVSLAYSGGLPTLTWQPASDSDGIRYYRIYRDGTAYADRYDVVSADQTSYTDQSPDPGGNTYWVTAVDNRYDESAPVQAVGP
jgi:fibronectin type 3 domain-containing protein